MTENDVLNGMDNLKAVGSLVHMLSGFGQESPGSILGTAKDPPSACGVRARKIRGSKSPVVRRYQFTVSGKNSPPIQRRIKIEGVDNG